MKGITVTLYERTQTGTDDFNRPIFEETAIQIPNVLIAPATETGEERLDGTDLVSRRAAYTLAIPKGDSHVWEGCRVGFFGEVWQVIGKPTIGLEHLIPLQWNKKVRVEAIE